ncbi:MAG: HAD family hydrolase [Chloroflexota bacterium]|jgi:putative hydrolase of the HAD superfamily
MRRFQTILFDLYDTLIWLDVQESNRWRQRFAQRLAVPIDAFFSVWRRSVNDRMLGKVGDLSNQITTAVSELGISPNAALIEELVAIERQRLEQSVKLYPNTVKVLERLAANGYRLGLLSNASDGAAIPITRLGIDKLFHQMILSHEVGLLKPDPAIYHLACQRLQSAPSETVFVADGGFGELDAAKDLGIYTVLIEQDNQSKDYGSSTRYDIKIGDIQEIENILDLS